MDCQKPQYKIYVIRFYYHSTQRMIKMINKKKILIIAPNYPRFPGGGGDQTILYQTLMLLKDKYFVKMLCIIKKFSDYSIPAELKNIVYILYHPVCKQINYNSNIQKIRNLMYEIKCYPKNGSQIFSYIESKLSDQINDFDPDFILFEQTGYSMVHWRRKLNVPLATKCILKIHDAIPIHLNRSIIHSKSRKEYLFKKLQLFTIQNHEKKYIKDWDAILTLSANEKEHYDMITSSLLPIHVTRVGIDTTYFSPGRISKRDIDMIFIGSMRWTPNVDNVVWFYNYVLPKVIRKLPNFRFVVVGRNPSKRVQELNSQNCIITGEVGDVRKYLNRSKLSFVFSFSGSGIKMKIMELLSMGIPVICDEESLQGYNDIDMGGVINVNKNDIDDIVKNIIEVLGDKKQWLALSKAANATARKYFDYRNIDYNFEEFLVK